jgi:hypothetical protein
MENNQDILTQNETTNKLPQMLNVLTILTFVGSAIALIGGIYNYFTVCKSVEDLTSKLEDLDLGNGTMAKMMQSSLEIANKNCENKLSILLVTIVGALLCLFGALLMRKLKKHGFLIYTAGELITPLASIVILGLGSMMGMLMLTGLIVPIVFIILYGLQRKHLVN